MIQLAHKARTYLETNVFDFGQPGTVGHYRIIFIAIVVLAALLRFWNLSGPSLWMDEGISIAFAELPTRSILFGRIDNHPPGSFLIQHVWQSIVPAAEYARVPAAAAGVGAVAILIAMVRDQISERTALIAGLIFAVATGHIYYSQEARMYAFLVLGVVTALWGVLGQVRQGQLRPRAYQMLYVVGAALAIYSHLLGLILMGLISLIGLIMGLLKGPRPAALKTWLIPNIVLFFIVLPWLLQIPDSLTFPGLKEKASIIDAIWHYRTMNSYPGIRDFEPMLTPILYSAVGIGTLACWLSGRRTLALCLFAIGAAYPVLLFMLSLNRPLISSRTMLPTIVPVAVAAAFTLSYLRIKWLGLGGAALLVLAGLASSLNYLAHPTKAENHKRVLTLMEEKGFEGAPILECADMSSTAAKILDPDSRIYLYRDGAIMRHPGAGYWKVAARSMTWYRTATIEDIDAELGGNTLIKGGLASAFAEESQVVFSRPFCDDTGAEEFLKARLLELGFVEGEERLLTDGAPNPQIVFSPRTTVTFYTREAAN